MDSTDAQGVESIVDLLELPRQQYFDEGVSHQARVAFVLPKVPALRKYSEFYKTACANRGWEVHLFETRDEAVDWLMSSHSSTKPNSRDFNNRPGFTRQHDRLPRFLKREGAAPHNVIFDVPDAELDKVFNVSRVQVSVLF